MGHSDVYTKFMIEYDKENVTTSYPSLNDFEIATLLDKAYLALIAQKLTGNNLRRVPFEGDIKAIEDIKPLICREENIQPEDKKAYYVVTPNNNDILYFVDAYTDKNDHILLISHEIFNKFIPSSNNMPWMKNPVCCMEDSKIIIATSQLPTRYILNSITLIYIKNPAKFVDDLDILNSNVLFELSDSMAEELINLALIMSTEIVESPRINTKAQLRGLES